MEGPGGVSWRKRWHQGNTLRDEDIEEIVLELPNLEYTRDPCQATLLGGSTFERELLTEVKLPEKSSTVPFQPYSYSK